MAQAEEEDNVDAPAEETTDEPTADATETTEETTDATADAPADETTTETTTEDKPADTPTDPPAEAQSPAVDDEDSKQVPPPDEPVSSPSSSNASASASSPTTTSTSAKKSSSNRTRSRTKSKTGKANAAPSDACDQAWQDISSKKALNNFYLCTPAGGKGKKKRKKASLKLDVAHSGDGGLDAMREILKNAENDVYFGILRVDAADNSGSSRAKFIYVRFVGTKVGVMKKAGLTPQLAAIDEKFPVKHLTYDLTEELIDFDIEPLVRAFLQVGGAHKPDKYVFGKDQEYIIPKD